MIQSITNLDLLQQQEEVNDVLYNGLSLQIIYLFLKTSYCRDGQWPMFRENWKEMLMKYAMIIFATNVQNKFIYTLKYYCWLLEQFWLLISPCKMYQATEENKQSARSLLAGVQWYNFSLSSIDDRSLQSSIGLHIR